MSVFNLTPHDIVVYDSAGQKVLWTGKSAGQLRLKSDVQVKLPDFVADDAGTRVPVISAQKFVGLDTTSPGYAVWRDNLAGAFIVSMPVAQYLATQSTGLRSIYCPATGPAHVVRNALGDMLGVKALEKHSA